MVFSTPTHGYLAPSLPWYIKPSIYGISEPSIRGILNPLSMEYQASYQCYIDPLSMGFCPLTDGILNSLLMVY